MKRLNGLFIILVLVMGLLSIAYIWRSEADKIALEVEVREQSQEIDSLKNKLSSINNTENNISNVQGATTAIGTVSGIVRFNNTDIINTTIVCAQDKFTIKEFCTDELVKTDNSKEFQYSLEIPKGKYLIYTVTPPESDKIYYSQLQKCVDNENCENNKKILLEIIEDEVQQNINLYY